MIKVVYKTWIEIDDMRVFGEGPYRLLKMVDATGSLRKAAAGMGMAYSKARNVITDCERGLGFSLTTRTTGGISGGGSALTTMAVNLLTAYELFRTDMEARVVKAYKKCFRQPVQIESCVGVPNQRGRKRLED